MTLGYAKVGGTKLGNFESIFIKLPYLGPPTLKALSLVTILNENIAVLSLETMVCPVKLDEDFVIVYVVKVKALYPTVVTFFDIKLIVQAA
jgi:hypothetical protein